MRRRSQPPRCDPEIYAQGELIATLHDTHDRPRSQAVEKWVRAVATLARANLDWHYQGNTAQVLHLGDDESYQRATIALRLHDRQSGIWLGKIFPRSTRPTHQVQTHR